MANSINFVVAKTNPNLYAAAKQSNINDAQKLQLEEFGFTVQKNKDLMKMPVEEAKKIFFDLEPAAQEKIKYLYPNAAYAEEDDTTKEKAIGAVVGVGKGLASPLIGLFSALGKWTRAINTPYLAVRQAAQGEGLFNKQTWDDAWNGRKVYDNGALNQAIEYFGAERVEIAQGLIAGLKPGEIVAKGGELNANKLKALEELYNDPKLFKQVRDAVSYSQVSPGRDIFRMFDTKPTKTQVLSGEEDYIDKGQKFGSGVIDFTYQIVVDPLTYLTFGTSKIFGGIKQGEKIAKQIQQFGPAGVKDVFVKYPGLAMLWDDAGKRLENIRELPAGSAERSTAVREFKKDFPTFNEDGAIEGLLKTEIVNAKSAVEYFSLAENTNLLLGGRVNGIQYFRNGVAVARDQRRLGMGLGRWIDGYLNPATRNTAKINEEGQDAFDILTKLGKDGELIPDDISDIKKFYKEMSIREKIAQRFTRSPQGGVILLGENAVKTADNFRAVARQVLPRDLADFVTQRFVTAEANDQVIIMRNMYYAIAQRFGLDGHPDGQKLIKTMLEEKFGSAEGLSIVSQLKVNSKFADEVGKVGLKVSDDGLLYESSGIIHPFQEAGAIGSLNYIEIAQMAGQIKSKKNLISAAGGATQLKLADDLVNAWSVLTLFPRLGIRSMIDESFMFLLTAPAKEVFEFATRKGHRLGKMATRYTGSQQAEPLREGLKKYIGAKRISDTFTSTQWAEKRSALAAKGEFVSDELVSQLDVAYGMAQDAVMPFTNRTLFPSISGDEANFMVEGLAHSAVLLNASTRSIAGAASITGKLEKELLEEIVPSSSYDLMLKDIDAVTGGSGFVTTEELARSKVYGGKGIAAVHFGGFIRRFYGNTKSLSGKNGKLLVDPPTVFFANNALETPADFRRAKDQLLLSIGIRRNTELVEQIGEDGVKLMSPKYSFVIEDEGAVREFLQMSSRSSELNQAKVLPVDIAVDQVDRILLDSYTTFHGTAEGFNANLLKIVRDKYDELSVLEKKAQKIIPDKWHRAVKSVDWDTFQDATVGFQPKGRMWTDLQIPGLTENFENVLKTYGNRAFELMDRQVTAGFRQPVVMLAYVRIRKNLQKIQADETRKTIARAIDDLGPDASKGQILSVTENVTEMVTRKYVQIAVEQAADGVLKFADNPNVRSNFALAQRNTSRFFRATEDFYRRVYRLRDVPLRVLYRTRLMHLGLNANGQTYQDANGDPYIMMPMDNIIFKTVDSSIRALGGNQAFKQPLFNDFTLKLKLMNPSFSPDAGVPTLSGPIAALGVLGTKALLGKTGTTGQLIGEELDNFALGNIGEGMDITRAVVPSILQKSFAILNKDEKNRQEATAAMQAIAYNASQGIGIDVNATPQEKADYLKQIRISAHNILVMRSILGMLSPIAPSTQESIGVPDYLKEVGITGLRSEFYDLVDGISKKYGGDVQDPYEMALATYIGKNPGKLVYTVARDNKTTNLVISKTKELKEWAISNKGLINTYGETAFLFAPNTGSFDSATYSWLEAAGLIESKSVEKYYTDILVSEDKQAYYNIGRDEKEALRNINDVNARRTIIAKSTAARSNLKLSNPLLEVALTAGGNEIASEELMLNNLESMLATIDVKIPDATRKKMIAVTSQVREFINLSVDSTARQSSNFAAVKRERKQQIEELIASLSINDLMLKEANRAIFRAILNYYSRENYVAIQGGF